MPDFERIHRSMNLHFNKVFTPEKVDIVKAFYAGQDHARKEIAYAAIIIASVASVLYYVLHKGV